MEPRARRYRRREPTRVPRRAHPEIRSGLAATRPRGRERPGARRSRRRRLVQAPRGGHRGRTRLPAGAVRREGDARRGRVRRLCPSHRRFVARRTFHRNGSKGRG